MREIIGLRGARSGLARALDGHQGVVLTGKWVGGGAVIAGRPVDVVADGHDPFAVLDDLPALRVHRSQGSARTGSVGGGWFGWLGFEAGADDDLIGLRAAQLPSMPALATSYWALYPNVVRYEASSGRWFDEALIGLVEEDELAARRSWLVQCVRDARAVAASPDEVGPLRSDSSLQRHVAAVQAGQRHIAAGDIYQVNLCLELSGPTHARPGQLYDTIVADLAPDYGAFVDAGASAVVSASPELFLRRRGRDVVSAPIKGTRPRPDDEAQAMDEARRLQGSAKDRAENIMITDLIRNDLSRVAEIGSVCVPALLRLEPHPGVWHLVSEVHARLVRGVSDSVLLRAMFPPGSVTGAPKLRALEVIAELELTRRGVYTGAIGFVSPAYGLELNVAIRTLAVCNGTLALGVGGGVTAGSQPLEEWWECFDKVSAIAGALGATIAVERSAREFSHDEPSR